MILPDTNMLLHAHNPDSVVHKQAVDWWQDCLSNTEAVGLAWIVVLGFVRISTGGRIFNGALTPTEAFEYVAEWTAYPHVHFVHPQAQHLTKVRELLESVGVAGNLTTGAHIAALAIEGGYIVHTTDTDFSRFPRIQWKNPLK